jgi:hypothetical protein
VVRDRECLRGVEDENVGPRGSRWDRLPDACLALSSPYKAGTNFGRFASHVLPNIPESHLNGL